MNQPSYLRAKDVANRFGVSTRTVWTWAAKGLLPYYKINRSVFFSEEDLDRILHQSRFIAGVHWPKSF
jgi:excisionase family DNA binding protein